MNDRRRGLGRGLGALIPMESYGAARPTDVFFSAEPSGAELVAVSERASGQANANVAPEQAPPADAEAPTGGAAALELTAVPGARLLDLSVTAIAPNPRQPRVEFDEDDLAELVHSIASVGVLQPVIVRAVEGAQVGGGNVDDEGRNVRYELVMGERRLRASIAAGMQTIPAIVRDTGDDDLLRDALLENLHRSQLNPLEEAAAYQQLLQDFGCTQDVLAQRLGRSRPHISNTIRLLRLPALVQRRVASGVLSAGHARALLGLDDVDAMERLAARIVAEGLSVRSVEEIVLLREAEPVPRLSNRRPPVVDPDVEQWSTRLSDALDTRVTIAMGKRKGRLSVEFASKDDLERILSVLAPTATPLTGDHDVGAHTGTGK